MKTNVIAFCALCAIGVAGASADPFSLSGGGNIAGGDTTGDPLMNTFGGTTGVGTAVVDSLFESEITVDDGSGAVLLASLPVLSQSSDGTTAMASYDGGTFTIDLSLTMNGDGTLSHVMDITGSGNLRIWNYVDFDVAGSAGADTATLLAPGHIRQVDDNDIFAEVMSNSPAPFAWEIGGFPGLRDSIAAGTDLTNTDGGTASADNAFAFQWNLDLAAGPSTIDQTYALGVVPAPASAALVAFGACFASRRRR